MALAANESASPQARALASDWLKKVEVTSTYSRELVERWRRDPKVFAIPSPEVPPGQPIGCEEGFLALAP